MKSVKVKKIVTDIARLVKSEFKAKEVILFGSFTHGKPSSSSDIDILVIMETKLKPYKQASLIRMRLDENLGVEFPMDLIVRTPEQIMKRLKLGDFFLKNILDNGIRL